MPERGLYQRNFGDAQRERALLSAVGFTGAFGVARGITHAIRAGVGPFRNMSAGGRHLHHSTFGIFGGLMPDVLKRLASLDVGSHDGASHDGAAHDDASAPAG